MWQPIVNQCGLNWLHFLHAVVLAMTGRIKGAEQNKAVFSSQTTVFTTSSLLILYILMSPWSEQRIQLVCSRNNSFCSALCLNFPSNILVFHSLFAFILPSWVFNSEQYNRNRSKGMIIVEFRQQQCYYLHSTAVPRVPIINVAYRHGWLKERRWIVSC